MRAVVTVVGHDKKGIIAKVSGALFENGINILDISQTIMQDLFTMIMLIDFEGSEESIRSITKKLDKVAEELEVSIRVQREEIFTSMHKI